MEAPVLIENCTQFTTPEQNDSGFPFDDTDYDSHDHIQSRLNDITARHPELASHFRGFDDFPSLRRMRKNSGEQQDKNTPSSSGPSSSRFADHHTFPTGFNRFPFTRHFEEEFSHEPHQDKPPEVPKQHDKRGRKPNPNLPQHLSNTVDLGQKQTPVEETRSQRSMSAPPENRSQSSSVSQESSNEDMGKTYSRQNTPQQSQPKERIIPIHVEGRDDPVMPKNPSLSSGGSAETIFGGERVQQGFFTPTRDPYSQTRKQAYEQFVPRASSHQQPPQQHQQQQHQQQQHQQARQQTPPAHQASPPPPPMSNDPLDKIKSVRSDVMALMDQVEKFQGTRKDREYLYLDEMLTRNLLKLDNVETEGKDNIRQARKEAIKCINTCISNLEAKAQAREMELKNNAESAESSKVESDIETQKSISSTSVPEQNQDEPEVPRFTSQATLIIAPPKSEDSQETVVDQQPSVVSMDVDPSVEKSNSSEEVIQAPDSFADVQPDTKESSQTANKDTTQN